MPTLGWKQILLIIGSLGLIVGLLAVVGVMPGDAFKELIHGSVGTKSAWNETLKHLTPLLIAGLAVYIALRAGLYNIGAEGQLLMGALSATIIALNIPAAWGTVIGIIAGTLAGALWALPAAWIKAYRNGHEVITTIMLNSIAVVVASGLLSGPLNTSVVQSTRTDFISKSTWLSSIYSDTKLQISIAIPFGIILIFFVLRWLRTTVSGYELSAVGASTSVTKSAGIDVKKTLMKAMLTSGALSGLAGAIQVFAYEHSFYSGFSSGFGFDALGVALLAGASPLGVLPSAFLFAVLAKGSISLQLLDIPKGLSGILVGIIIIVFASFRYRRKRNV